MAMKNPALAVDLDGTLLHPEPEAIAVKGSSGFQYMSKKAGNLLERISQKLPIIIATGRNAASISRLTQQLSDTCFAGFVMENGMVSRTCAAPAHRKHDPWQSLVQALKGWERLEEYENCLGVRVPDKIDSPLIAVKKAMAASGTTGFIYTEPKKVFIYPSVPSKLAGIRQLGFAPFIVIGDEKNDLDMIEAAFHPATLCTAHENVLKFVAQQNGYCSKKTSHAATEDMLEWAENIVNKHY
ncbi:HAD hydrolase family protein [Desulfobacterales bacterium HSG16]|nr:HAD hydrolase family protein [Desulfobacterales bacterium HSG16]